MKPRNNPRILFAYTTSQKEPFKSLERNGALKTWTRHLSSGCKVVSLQAKKTDGFSICHSYSIIFEQIRWGRFGRLATIAARVLGKPFSAFRPKSELVGSSLQINIPEGLTFLGFKLLGAIDLMIRDDFDFLVYTNLSSYLNTYRVSEILSSVDPSENYYAGKRLPSDLNKGISGSFIVLSRETCVRIQSRRFSWNHAYLDDIALFKLMGKLKIEPTILDSLGILDPLQIASVQRKELLQYAHFKCGPQFVGAMRSDFVVMHHLDNILFPDSDTSRN